MPAFPEDDPPTLRDGVRGVDPPDTLDSVVSLKDAKTPIAGLFGSAIRVDDHYVLSVEGACLRRLCSRFRVSVVSAPPRRAGVVSADVPPALVAAVEAEPENDALLRLLVPHVHTHAGGHAFLGTSGVVVRVRTLFEDLMHDHRPRAHQCALLCIALADGSFESDMRRMMSQQGAAIPAELSHVYEEATHTFSVSGDGHDPVSFRLDAAHVAALRHGVTRRFPVHLGTILEFAHEVLRPTWIHEPLTLRLRHKDDWVCSVDGCAPHGIYAPDAPLVGSKRRRASYASIHDRLQQLNAIPKFFTTQAQILDFLLPA